MGVEIYTFKHVNGSKSDGFYVSRGVYQIGTEHKRFVCCFRYRACAVAFCDQLIDAGVLDQGDSSILWRKRNLQGSIQTIDYIHHIMLIVQEGDRGAFGVLAIIIEEYWWWNCKRIKIA